MEVIFSIFPSSLNIHREGEPDPDARRPPTDVRGEYYAIVFFCFTSYFKSFALKLLKEEDILLIKSHLQ